MVQFKGFTPDSFVDFMKASYGPVLRVFARIADDPERTRRARCRAAHVRARLDRGLPGAPRLEAEYQLTLARRA